mmetsp:Transcript_11872/g.27839  ORF Transcript_11872/g.27839 Transcript_11872/m.27839 type:complete len:599 (-) Transcript_11872:120-1916(-)
MAAAGVLAALGAQAHRQVAGRAHLSRFFGTSNAIYDFIVVGAGASGAVLASRLSEDASAQVLLIEAGEKPIAECSIPALCGGLQGTVVDWQQRDAAPPGTVAMGMENQRMKIPHGKALGGSTSINYMAYVRGHPGDYDSWGFSGWSYKDVLPYFKKSEDFSPGPEAFSKGDTEVHGVGGPYSVSYRDPPHPSTTAFVRAAELCGFTAGDYNGADRVTAPRGPVSPHQFTIRKGERCSTYTAFLEPIMGTRPNLTVFTGTQALRLVLRDGKVMGVDHSTGRAAASKEVIVSCGSYMSPNLLLSSGIGPRKELGAMGLDCLVDSPHVGKNLRDHLLLVMPFPIESGTSVGQLAAALGMTEDKSIYNEYKATGKGLLATSLYDASVFTNTGVCEVNKHTHDGQISWCVSAFVPDLYAKNLAWEGFTPENFDFGIFDPSVPSGALVPQLLQPRSIGEVRLSDAKPGSLPIIQHNYLTHPMDMKMFVAICKEAAAIKAKMPGAGSVAVPKRIVAKHGDDLDSDELLEAWIRHYSSTVYHPVATCSMGRVVDERCNVMGVSQLRVVDASIMPDVPSGNTQAPCVMIGENAAAMIAADHGLSLQS